MESPSPQERYRAGAYTLEFGPEYYGFWEQLLNHYLEIGSAPSLAEASALAIPAERRREHWLLHLAKVLVHGLEEPYGEMNPLSRLSPSMMAIRLLGVYGEEFLAPLVACLRLRYCILERRVADCCANLHDFSLVEFLCKIAGCSPLLRHQFTRYAWECLAALSRLDQDRPQAWQKIAFLIFSDEEILLCRCSGNQDEHSSLRLSAATVRARLGEVARLPEFTASRVVSDNARLLAQRLDAYVLP